MLNNIFGDLFFHKNGEIQIFKKMIEMISFHHHSSMYKQILSKPTFGGCAQTLLIYTTELVEYLLWKWNLV